MKAWARRFLRDRGWTVHRWPAARFEAMEDALTLLRRGGFAPAIVIDVGANVGSWTDLAVEAFDAREYHLVEPQAECQAPLVRYRPPRFIVHPVALSAAGNDVVRLLGGGTGAHVVPGDAPDATTYPATSLDALLGDRVRPADRVLLKVDAEGHDLTILRAAGRVLEASEVVIAEFRVYDVEGSGNPLLSDLVTFMSGQGFLLYDLAALNSRRRDERLRSGDAVFVRASSPLAADNAFA